MLFLAIAMTALTAIPVLGVLAGKELHPFGATLMVATGTIAAWAWVSC